MIKFEFTIEQVNSILQALGKSPAEFSLNPIILIQNAAGPQVEELMKKQEEEKKDEQ
jgi:hypothetical protein